MAKYLKLEQALNKLSTGNSFEGPFRGHAGVIQNISKEKPKSEDFVSELADYIEEKIKNK